MVCVCLHSRCVEPMPSSPTRHSEEPEERSFSVTLTVYSTVKKKVRGKLSTAATKEEKSLKRKELLFAVNHGNYLEFLQRILEKHGQGQYIVSERKRFPFKFVDPQAKGYVHLLYTNHYLSYVMFFYLANVQLMELTLITRLTIVRW